MKVTREKNCYCITCKKWFHYLGITRHRAMHRDRKEDCEITYTNSDTCLHQFSNRHKNNPTDAIKKKEIYLC